VSLEVFFPCRSCLWRLFFRAGGAVEIPAAAQRSEVLEWLGGTISPLTAKQARILGESSG
jgi:hypothetical protein